MSKLYDRYQKLKEENENMIYMFECGVFYIFLDEDSHTMSKILNLKETIFSGDVVKCGFPKKSLATYQQQLEEQHLVYQIISSPTKEPKGKVEVKENSSNVMNHKLMDYLEYIKSVDLKSLESLECYMILYCLQGELNHG